MNHRSSYRKLLANGKAALLSAIEIYNKPRIEYREECFVILLLNAWELTLKAILSKNRESIFYPKRRKESYRTYSLMDAFRRAAPYIPENMARDALRYNLEALSTYRDNAVHFYNERRFGTVIYALAQTSIVNLKDILREVFRIDLAKDITWQLLPLGLAAPIDAVEYISGKQTGPKQSAAAKQFLAQLIESSKALESVHMDTGRLLTVFNIKLESVKKIGDADVTLGIQGSAEVAAGPLVITKSLDPNVSHPLKTLEAVEAVGTLHGQNFTSGAFQAIAWKFGMKLKASFCWKSSKGELVKYSHDAVTFIKRLTPGDVELAKKEYRERNQRKMQAPATATLPFVQGERQVDS